MLSKQANRAESSLKASGVNSASLKGGDEGAKSPMMRVPENIPELEWL